MKKSTAGNPRRRLALRPEVIRVFENRHLTIVGGRLVEAMPTPTCPFYCDPLPPPKTKQ